MEIEMNKMIENINIVDIPKRLESIYIKLVELDLMRCDHEVIKSETAKKFLKELMQSMHEDLLQQVLRLLNSIKVSDFMQNAIEVEKSMVANEEYQKVKQQFGFPDSLSDISNKAYSRIEAAYDILSGKKIGKIKDRYNLEKTNLLNSDVDVKLEMKKYGFVDIDDLQSLIDKVQNDNDDNLENECTKAINDLSSNPFADDEMEDIEKSDEMLPKSVKEKTKLSKKSKTKKQKQKQKE